MAQADFGKILVSVVIFIAAAFVILSITNQFDITDVTLKSALFFLILGVSMAVALNLIFSKNQDNLVSVVSIFVLIGIGFLFFSYPQLVPISFSSVDVQNNPISNALTGSNFTSFPWLGILLAIIVLFILNKAFRENVKMLFGKIGAKI